MSDASDDTDTLPRAQRRYLRRIFNGRTVPLIADGKPLLTYKDGVRYLLSLEAEARDAAYEAMKAEFQAASKSSPEPE